MKQIFIILLFMLSISIYSQGVYAINNNEKISYEKNTNLNIKGSKLIKKYLYSLLKNLDELKIKYKLENNKDIKKYSQTLNSMIILLSKIQNTNISKQKAEEVMRVIIKELKPLNKDIKILLKIEKAKEKRKAYNLKQKYYTLSLNLSQTLDKIIIKYYLKIKKSTILNKKDKIILQNLRNLKRSSDSLKKIKKINLSSISDIKIELLNILKNIKKELFLLKGNI